MSKVAARGGVALSIVGLGIACHEMSLTDDVDRKNDIFVETVGSIAGGAAVGVAATIGIAFMMTPVGLKWSNSTGHLAKVVKLPSEVKYDNSTTT